MKLVGFSLLLAFADVSGQDFDTPSVVISDAPSMTPSDFLSTVPSDVPSTIPSDVPSDFPSLAPTAFLSLSLEGMFLCSSFEDTFVESGWTLSEAVEMYYIYRLEMTTDADVNAAIAAIRDIMHAKMIAGTCNEIIGDERSIADSVQVHAVGSSPGKTLLERCGDSCYMVRDNLTFHAEKLSLSSDSAARALRCKVSGIVDTTFSEMSIESIPGSLSVRMIHSGTSRPGCRNSPGGRPDEEVDDDFLPPLDGDDSQFRGILGLSFAAVAIVALAGAGLYMRKRRHTMSTPGDGTTIAPVSANASEMHSLM